MTFQSRQINKITLFSGTNNYTPDNNTPLEVIRDAKNLFFLGKFQNTNTTTGCTLNIGGLTTIPLTKNNGQALLPNDLSANTVYIFFVNGTNVELSLLTL